MKSYKLLLTGALLLFSYLSAADPLFCTRELPGYRVVKGSVFEFSNGDQRECFFAFYVNNSDHSADAKGCRNSGDTLWYGYFTHGGTVTELERPSVDESWMWNIVNAVDAVSFVDVNGDGARDVTVIGSNTECAWSVRVPVVFLRKGSQYVLDKDLTLGLLGNNDIDVSGVKDFYRHGPSVVK